MPAEDAVRGALVEGLQVRVIDTDDALPESERQSRVSDGLEEIAETQPQALASQVAQWMTE